MISKLARSLSLGLKICFVASFMPVILSKWRELISGDIARVKKILRRALGGYARSTAFITFGNAIPLVWFCVVPLNTRMIRNWPTWLKIVPEIGIMTLFLLVERTSRIPSYLGICLRMALSLLWHILKLNRVVIPIPFEKFISFALLAGLIGFLSVHKSRKLAIKT